MESVILNEVGPRDGLQSQSVVLTTQERVELINIILQTGITHIEVGSFVSPKAVPAMADTDKVLESIFKKEANRQVSKKNISVLIPNIRGFTSAVKAGAEVINFVICSTDKMNVKNVGKDIKQLLDVFKEISEHEHFQKVVVNAYISTAWDCPFDGKIEESVICNIADRLVRMGTNNLIISDSIGSANPTRVKSLLSNLKNITSVNTIGCHFHDTRSLALANIYAALEQGVRMFDAAIGGLGGCPFAPGASGNVATEDVAFLLAQEGFSTGIDLAQLINAVESIQNNFSITCAGGKTFKWQSNH